MIALDTNVLVRYLTQDDPEQARRATQALGELSSTTPGFVPTLVWAETYWVLTRAYKVVAATVVETLAAFAASVEIEPEDPRTLAEAIAGARNGADFADALIDAAARRAGCDQVVTFDRRASSLLGWRRL